MTKPESIFVEQFVDTGLGNSAYLVGSRESKRAALIDPLRDVDRYRHAADQQGVAITHVLDTHLHNDFVSGAREIAAQTGAVIGASAQAGVEFEHLALGADQLLDLGGLRLKVLATPGHTPEHVAFLLEDDGAPRALFSGGALMVGGAARTDLLGHEHAVPFARELYHTLHDHLLQLPDHVGVYPTHGAGSFCSAPVSAERTTTIAQERRRNALVQARDEDEFVRRALSNLPSYPVYYPRVRALNRAGPRVLGGLPEPKPLNPDEARAHLAQGAAMLDIRPRKESLRGYVEGAYLIPLTQSLIVWAGWLIPFGTPLILVGGDEAKRREAVRQLIRIGFDDLRGFLDGGVEAWAAAGGAVATVAVISAAQLRERLQDGDPLVLLDVRHTAEWNAGHIPGARHIENGKLPWEQLDLPHDRPIAVQCAHGDRSAAAASVLRRRGYHDLVLVEGGYTAWAAAGFEVARDK